MNENEKKWDEIERKHNGRCFWQQRVGNGTILAECIYFPRLGEHGSTAIVIKHFAKALPRSGSSKPWPEMETCDVYVPIGGNTWAGLDKALADLSLVPPAGSSG